MNMDMFLVFAILSIGMVGLIAFVVEVVIPRVVVILGNVDSWWSPLRTLPPPGEMYILVRGAPDGPFDNVIESVVGFGYDNNTHLFTDDQPTPPETYLRQLGVVWVGFNRYFLWREMRYDKWEMIINDQGKPTGKWGLVPKVRGVKGKEGDNPAIFFRYNMATKIVAAETVGNFPVDAIVVFTVQIRNPVQALFFAGGWEAQTNAAVQGVFREYVSVKTVAQLMEEKAAGADTLVARIKNLSNSVDRSKGLRELFGTEIVDARFVEFDLVSGDRDEAMLKATRAVEIATLNAAAAAKDGEGERRRRQERAAGVRAEVEAWGANPVGATVAMAEAIKEAKPNVLGGGVIASVEARREPPTETRK